MDKQDGDLADRDFLTLHEHAARLGYALRTVQNLAGEGK